MDALRAAFHSLLPKKVIKTKLSVMRNLIFMNPVFWSVIISLFIAQLSKCFVEARVNHHFTLRTFTTNGGMPSSHACSVASLANAIGLTEGYGSTIFVFSFLFALVVFNDATNVRLETGKQAQTINQWSKFFSNMFSKDAFPEEHLKTLVGHTKLQVLWGMIIGIIVSTFICVWFI